MFISGRTKQTRFKTTYLLFSNFNITHSFLIQQIHFLSTVVELWKFGNKDDIADYTFSPEGLAVDGDEAKTSLSIDLDSITDKGECHFIFSLPVLY